MSSRTIQDEGQTLGPPTGKVLGIVETRETFDALVKAMEGAGFNKIKALEGTDGVNLLERVNTFFFSDMEERVLNRHIEELKAGHLIVAIETSPDRVEEAVEIASRSGARRLVHFGALAVTWHTK